MSASPLVEARHGADPFVLVTTGSPFEATAATSLDVRLADTAGVVTWELTCVGTDETTAAVEIVRDAPPAFSGTIAVPSGSGRALIYRSRVNGGIANGAVDPALTTTLKIWVPTADGLQVGALNETFESDDEFGTTGIINAAIRASGNGDFPAGTGFVVVGGGTPDVMDGSGQPALIGGVPTLVPFGADGEVWTMNGGEPEWAPPAGGGGSVPAFSASSIVGWDQDIEDWVELSQVISPAGGDTHYAIFQEIGGGSTGAPIGLPLGDAGDAIAAIVSGVPAAIVVDDIGQAVAYRGGELVVTRIDGSLGDADLITNHVSYNWLESGSGDETGRVGFFDKHSFAALASSRVIDLPWGNSRAGVIYLSAQFVQNALVAELTRKYRVHETSGGTLTVTEIGSGVFSGDTITGANASIASAGNVFRLTIANATAGAMNSDVAVEGGRLVVP